LSVTASFLLKVDPPGKDSFNLTNLGNMLSGSNNPLDELIAGGDPRKALSMAGVIGSVLNHVDSNSNTSRNMTADEMARRREESQKVDEVRIIGNKF
jgi:hypothetical protein